jgi:hypothetical protein
LKFDDCSQSRRENIVTEYAFKKKHFVFWQIFTPKIMILEALQIHIGNFSKCFIVLYKHSCTLKVKRQISHAYMWSLVSQFFYFFLCPLNLDQCFLFFHFLILKISQNCLFFVPKFAIGLEIKIICHLNLFQHKSYCIFIVLAYQGKDIVFIFIMEYSSLRDFGPYVIGLFLYEDL